MKAHFKGILAQTHWIGLSALIGLAQATLMAQGPPPQQMGGQMGSGQMGGQMGGQQQQPPQQQQQQGGGQQQTTPPVIGCSVWVNGARCGSTTHNAANHPTTPPPRPRSHRHLQVGTPTWGIRGSSILIKTRFNPKTGKVELTRHGVVGGLKGFLNLNSTNNSRSQRKVLRGYRLR